MKGTRRRVGGQAAGKGLIDGEHAAFALAGVVLVFGALAWVSLTLGAVVVGETVNWNPPAALIEVMFGQRRWPLVSTGLLMIFLGLLGAGVVCAADRWRNGGAGGKREPIDAFARLMTHPRKLTGVTAREAEAVGNDLFGPDRCDSLRDPHWRRGLRLGTAVTGGTPIYMPWNSVTAMVGGTGSGKTTAVAVPALLEAPGAAVATSNGPDIWRDTHAVRRGLGQVWLCDLQGVTGHARTEFWVDLLTQARAGLSDARRLAGFFVAASKDKNARTDAYFDGGAQELLAIHLLAAAVAGGDLLHVRRWLGNDADEEPILLLALYGESDAAHRIREAQQITPRQRDGLYDMARRFLDVLSERRYQQVVTPPARAVFNVSGDVERALRGDVDHVVFVVDRAPATHQLPELDIAAFAASTDTLYSLSQKGAGSTASLTSALVGEVLHAAIQAAKQQPNARLAVPMLLVLDEAANICPLPDLPDMYSWLRKHAIVPMVFIQSRPQGEAAWGRDGWEAITSQAVHIYGGNVDDATYLEHWAKLVGDAQVASTTHSRGPGGGNRSTGWSLQPIFTVADLAEMSLERALVRFPGNPPVLIRKRKWFADEDLKMLVGHAQAAVEELPGLYPTPAPSQGKEVTQ